MYIKGPNQYLMQNEHSVNVIYQLILILTIFCISPLTKILQDFLSILCFMKTKGIINVYGHTQSPYFPTRCLSAPCTELWQSVKDGVEMGTRKFQDLGQSEGLRAGCLGKPNGLKLDHGSLFSSGPPFLYLLKREYFLKEIERKSGEVLNPTRIGQWTLQMQAPTLHLTSPMY